jgi:multidrug transporter EmrE-like cation transporter
MKKARIILTMIALSAILVGMMSFRTTKRRGLSNLFYRTTGNFFQNGASRNLTYAGLSPYRTFRTNISELPINVGYPLFTGTTQSTTTIGGSFYFITVVKGAPWHTWLGIYHDNGQ